MMLDLSCSKGIRGRPPGRRRRRDRVWGLALAPPARTTAGSRTSTPGPPSSQSRPLRRARAIFPVGVAFTGRPCAAGPSATTRSKAASSPFALRPIVHPRLGRRRWTSASAGAPAADITSAGPTSSRNRIQTSSFAWRRSSSPLELALLLSSTAIDAALSAFGAGVASTGTNGRSRVGPRPFLGGGSSSAIARSAVLT